MNDDRQVGWPISSRPTSAANSNPRRTSLDPSQLLHKKTWAPPPRRPLGQESAAGALSHGSDPLSQRPRPLSTRHLYRSSMAVDLGTTSDDIRYQYNHLASGSSLNAISVNHREPTGGRLSPQADIHSYQSTGTMSYRHQYSSSQAQLQSLTGPALFNDTPRKTPNKQKRSHQHQSPQEYRSQLSLASTKPMMTSMLNEPSPFTTTATMSRQLTTTMGRPTLATQNVVAAPHPVQATTTNNNFSHPLPPPYSVDATPLMQQQTITQASTLHPQNNHHHQHVICQQPPSQFPCNVDSNSIPPPLVTTSGRPGQANTSSSSSFPTSNLQSTSQQQQVHNFLGSQVPSSSASVNFPTSFSHHQQYPGFLHHAHHPHHHHHNQLHHNSTSETANSNCQQQPNQHHPSIVGLSKSKSCLTCADISIKWYIVVIALLGLICALIGTIVGAVHSAGRDYISLALLLIGVGLVLVAISWIALRITIKTYKSSLARSSARAPHPTVLRPTHMARLFGPVSQSAGGNAAVATTSSLHRTLLNERLYMMAAAAAAISRQNNPTQSSQHQPESQPQPSSSNNGTSSQRIEDPSSTGGLMSSIKQRLPRRLARLIPYSSLGGNSVSGSQQANLASPSTFLRRSTSANATDQASSNSFTHNIEPSLGNGATNPGATLAAAHAILQQYQGTLLPGQLPAAVAAAAFLFPAPPPPHLFGFPGTGLEYSFRPPPPSYNASMQDYRLRMLLQERAGLQQMNSVIPNSHPPPPPPPPPQAFSQSQLQNGARSVSNENVVVDGVGTQTSEIGEPAATTSTIQSTTVVIESSLNQRASETEGCPRLSDNRAPSADQMPNASSQRDSYRLKSSSSAPSIGTLVTNDIYVTSEDCVAQEQQQQMPHETGRHEELLEAPASQLNNSTTVNIGSSTTTIGALAGNSSSNHQQDRKSGRKSEAKILGYL